jgi:hypothetical protein
MDTNTFLLLELPPKMTTSNNNQLKLMQTTSEQAAHFFWVANMWSLLKNLTLNIIN